MLQTLLSQNEGKTLEFKESTQSLKPIIKAIIAFANTSGGTIVIGVRDGSKDVVGVENILLEEERLASAIADSIEPLLIPDIQIISFRQRELFIIQVPHMTGPYYLKSTGIERGIYVRLGSTNRIADNGTILALQMLAKHISYDELPCMGATLSSKDDKFITEKLSQKLGNITKKQYESLGIVSQQQRKLYPTNGGILLFSEDRLLHFPDSTILCVCFADESREKIIDQKNIRLPLIYAHEEILIFIKRLTKTAFHIGEAERTELTQYPEQAIREAVINAIVHADYAMQGVATQIAIFSNRIEITNPGGLTYGQSMAMALSGISKMRNRMIGRLFRELQLIERLGTGLQRIMRVYANTRARPPEFVDMDTHFRVTLYSLDTKAQDLEIWQQSLLDILTTDIMLGTAEIAEHWHVTTRTARSRLKTMLELDLIERVATSQKDPHAVFKRKI